jgi:hypothetical protein
MRNKHPDRSIGRLVLGVVLLTITTGCATKPTAPGKTGLNRSTKATASAEPTEAPDILLRMARYLAAAPRFSVNITGHYDAVQASGQQIEFGKKLRINVERPQHLRVEAVGSNGHRQWLFFDGQTLTTYSPVDSVYAQVAKPGDIDTAVNYFLNDLHMPLPLAALLLSRFPEEVSQHSQSVDYVEATGFYGTPAHHLAGRTEAVDYEVWVTEGAQPLPQRIVLTYRDAEGQPAFRAQFSDWDLGPSEKIDYTFKPPTGVRQIPFAAQVPQTALRAQQPAPAKGLKP